MMTPRAWYLAIGLTLGIAGLRASPASVRSFGLGRQPHPKTNAYLSDHEQRKPACSVLRAHSEDQSTEVR